MMLPKKMRRSICLVAAFLLSVLFIKPYPALAAGRAVRVAFPDYMPFSATLPDGGRTGIVYDYLSEIEKLTGWTLNYQRCTPENAIMMLENGVVDIAGGIYKEQGEAPPYDFAAISSGSSYFVLAVNESDMRYSGLDYSSFSGMRVGVYSKSRRRIEELEEFSRANDLQLVPVYYDDNKSCRTSIDRGETDAILTDDALVPDNLRAVARVGSSPFYFAVGGGQTDILRELNAALEAIAQNDPGFESSVRQKHLTPKSSDRPSFAIPELTYMKTIDKLRVVMVPDYLPLCSFNEKTGEPTGVLVDVMERISGITGVPVKFIETETLEESLSVLKSGGADIILGLSNDREFAGKHGLTLSRAVMSSQDVMVRNARNASLAGNKMRLAVPEGLPYSVPVSMSYEGGILTFPNVDKCIRAVNMGRAEFFFANSLVVENYTHNRGYRNLVMMPITDREQSLCIAFFEPDSPLIVSIINKALASIPADQLQSIMFDNTVVKLHKLSLPMLVYSNPIPYIVTALLLFILGVWIVVVFARMRYSLARRIAMEDEYYRILGEIADEYLFEYDYDENAIVYSEAFAKLVGVTKLPRPRDLTANGTEYNDERAFLQAFDPETVELHPSIDFICTMADGRREWFRAIATVIFDSSQKPIRGIGKLVSIQKELDEKRQLRHKATTDPLTGLYNRSCFEESVSSVFNGSAPVSCALLLIDLDRFKQVADSLGHSGGDRVLLMLASILRDTFPDNDMLARWGWDDFTIFMRDIDSPDTVRERAQQLLKAMCSDFSWEGKTAKLSLSIGVALGECGGGGPDFGEMFKAADDALHSVKHGNGNGYLMVNTKDISSHETKEEEVEV